MKLHYHPVSTSCRPVLVFLDEAGVKYEPILVDLMTGEHHGEAFTALNPNRCVPVLDDEGFVMTESSAIMKYVADKVGSPLYPKDLRHRARVNEMMDWFNTGFYRDWGYNLLYPQLFPTHQRKTEEGTRAAIEWGLEKSQAHLAVLEQRYLAKQPFVTGDQMTIADIFGASIVAAGRVAGAKFASHPRIAAWLSRIEERPTWIAASKGFEAFTQAVSGKTFTIPS